MITVVMIVIVSIVLSILTIVTAFVNHNIRILVNSLRLLLSLLLPYLLLLSLL